MSQPARRRAFTMIEVLVVLAIVYHRAWGSWCAPVQRVREDANRLQCQNEFWPP